MAFDNWSPRDVRSWLVKYHYDLIRSSIKVIQFLGTYYSVKQFIYLRDNPVEEVLGGYNLATLFNEYKAKKETWLILSIVSGVIFLIIALIVIFLRKRIVIAIALVKEGSKYVSLLKIKTILYVE